VLNGFFDFLQPEKSTTSTTENPLPVIPDECEMYAVLAETNRKALTVGGVGGPACDSGDSDNKGDYIGAGWYRFQGSGYTQMATSQPSFPNCGTDENRYWFTGELPTTRYETTSALYCYESCDLEISGKVTNCDTFYVFYLGNLDCNLGGPARYCAE